MSVGLLDKSKLQLRKHTYVIKTWDFVFWVYKYIWCITLGTTLTSKFTSGSRPWTFARLDLPHVENGWYIVISGHIIFHIFNIEWSDYDLQGLTKNYYESEFDILYLLCEFVKILFEIFLSIYRVSFFMWSIYRVRKSYFHTHTIYIYIYSKTYIFKNFLNAHQIEKN